MTMDNNTDYAVKPDLIRDMINLLDIEPYDHFNVQIYYCLP